jgi:transposase
MKEGNTMRPTKLDDIVEKKIIDLIRAGNYIETASACVGINKSTLYDWLKRGAREAERLEQNPKAKPNPKEEIYMKFSNAVEIAMAEAEARDVMIIANASKADWKASAWRLERKYPNKWGRQDHVEAKIQSEHTDKKEYFIEHQIDADPQTVELVRQLWRRKQLMEAD